MSSLGANQGLVVAEVELTSPDQAVDLPDWVGREVSHDPRYHNSNLARHPFTQWGD
jgi:adenylate cyclase